MSKSRIGQEFMEKTRYKYHEQTAQEKGLPQPPLELDYNRSLKVIELPTPENIHLGNVDFRKILDQRTSLRKYAETPLSLEELSFLLWSTQGVKEVSARPVTLRTVPSAGARHAFETYLLINRVEGLKPGLYRFLAIDHKLVELNLDSDLASRLTQACFKQKMVETCAVAFFWVAVVERMEWRYWQRGYRYLFLDAGHVCQNLYLSAEAIDCGVCAIAAYSDDDVNQILEVNGVEEFVIYLGTVGKR